MMRPKESVVGIGSFVDRRNWHFGESEIRADLRVASHSPLPSSQQAALTDQLTQR